jgi:hypothetical protein
MEQPNKVTIPDMIKRLDDMFILEKQLKNQILQLCKQLEQVQEDQDLLQRMIMHRSNKMSRGG